MQLSLTVRAFRSSVTSKFFHFSILALLLLFIAAPAFAQEAAIVGTVTDPTGAAIPNVPVAITNLDTGVATTVTTNADGQYIASNLRIGKYAIKVEAKGFKRVDQSGIVLQVGDRNRYDFKLEIGAASEHVTVEAAAEAVQTDSGEISQVVTSQQVADIAANGKSLYSLVGLTPGASTAMPDFQVNTAVGGNANVSFNGQRPGHNLYMLDGGETYDRGSGGTNGIAPSLEAIAEFRTLTSNYAAEYGMSSGGTISSVLKSGTKTFHASAWENTRNDALDARGYFNKTKAKLRFHTYGFNAGGQLPFDKAHPTFFFYNMEWRSLIQGGSLNTTVPYTDTYGGVFSAAHAPAGLHVPCANQLGGVGSAQYNRFVAAGITPPAGNADGTCTANQPFPTAADGTVTIPATLINNDATKLLAAGIFPAPNNGSRFSGGNAPPTKVREEIIRVDRQINSKFSVFGHFVDEKIGQGFGTTMWSGDNVPSASNSFANPSYSLVLHSTHIISPTLLNEIAFNWNGNRITIAPTGTVISAPTGYSNTLIFGNADPTKNLLNRAANINLTTSNTNWTQNWVPWTNGADSYSWKDDVSWTKGVHQFKLGGEFLFYKKVQTSFVTTQGNYNFDGSYTGSDFADMLLGYAQQYTEGALQDKGDWRSKNFGFYFQDNWRASKRLTVNLGLRWDGMPHTYEATGRMGNFYANQYDPTKAATFGLDANGNKTTSICTGPENLVLGTNFGCSAASPGLGSSPAAALAGVQFYLNGIGVAGKNGVPLGLVNNRWMNFGPRLGLSYDLTGSGKTVVRAGFGVMYERIQGNDMYNGAGNIPFSANVTVKNVLMGTPLTGVNGSTMSVPVLPADVTGLVLNGNNTPTNYMYSGGIEHSFGEKTVLSLSYVGSRSTNQNYAADVNLPAINLLPQLVRNSNKLADGTPYDQVVPYLGFNSLKQYRNDAAGHYNSFQASLRGQATRDLYLQAGYTLSRSIDAFNNGSGSNGDLNNISNPYVGWQYDLGPSAYDRTHVAFVSFVYELPIFRGNSSRALKAIAGGWEVSGVGSFSSGAPLNIGVSGNNVSSVIPNSSNRPDLTGTITYPKTCALASPTATLMTCNWLSGSAFTKPADGTWGNLPSNAVRGPGRQNWNASMFKKFVISEERGSRVELRADAFNLFNHTQLQANIPQGGMSTNYGAGDFGQITAAYAPRSLQLGVRVFF
jgi:Carboxypeptidase regulatory-like domain/TonB-dependent Receptor Plug Domain